MRNSKCFIIISLNISYTLIILLFLKKVNKNLSYCDKFVLDFDERNKKTLLPKGKSVIFYKALIDSTGFFFAAFLTGRKVETTAVKIASAIIIAIETIPKLNIEAPSESITS